MISLVSLEKLTLLLSGLIPMKLNETKVLCIVLIKLNMGVNIHDLYRDDTSN